LEPEVSQAFDSAVRTLVRLGHVERIVDLPDLPTLDAALTCIMTVEAIAAHGDLLQRSPSSFGRGFRKAVAPGYLFTALDKLRADEVRGRLRANLREAWRSVDIILTPTLPWVAPHVGSRSVPPRGPFTGLANLAGNPSLTVPCGLGEENLPVGLMLSGRVSDDVTVLAIGDEYQSVTSWHTRSPFIASQPRSDELPEVRVEGVAHPVSEQIERQDDRGNR
jgi:aspartyl-tRNA(Asn)/glutamyl-tRNA(Gln) amidotransferase subunit A